ncbi:MAG TPA: DUF3501 family protein [Stellaceae bacterium]|jgi:hypothetical protein|nr:DUF3501 family protein [Stellaceae bacterium]
MPHALARADILPPDEYAAQRREHRQRIGELKRNRRVEVGPFVTFYFECFETMWLQVQEMLHIERGGEAQIADELAAYNPMIPNGSELSATVMIEIEDAERRQAALSRLGGIEHKMFLSIAGEIVRGLADPTRENTSPDGKASSVQFIKFPLTPAHKEKFRTAGAQVVVGIDHPDYGHMAVMSEPVRQALMRDLE